MKLLTTLETHVQTGLFLSWQRLLRFAIYGTLLDISSTYLYIYEYGLSVWQQHEANQIVVNLSKTNVGIFSVLVTSPIEFLTFFISTQVLYLVFVNRVLPRKSPWPLKLIGEAAIWAIILYLVVYVPAGNFHADLMKYFRFSKV